MPYDYQLAVSARISAAVAEDMIRRTVESQTGKKIASIQADCKDGKLQGFSVMFENEQPAAGSRGSQASPDRSFRLTTYG